MRILSASEDEARPSATARAVFREKRMSTIGYRIDVQIVKDVEAA